MALSQCPNPSCESHSFQLCTIAVAGASDKLNAIQCARCGTVVSVLTLNDPGKLALDNRDLLKALHANLAELAQAQRALQSQLDALGQQVRDLGPARFA